MTSSTSGRRGSLLCMGYSRVGGAKTKTLNQGAQQSVIGKTGTIKNVDLSESSKNDVTLDALTSIA
jgi:hypothetical protein